MYNIMKVELQHKYIYIIGIYKGITYAVDRRCIDRRGFDPGPHLCRDVTI